jgi:hypothetical protein
MLGLQDLWWLWEEAVAFVNPPVMAPLGEKYVRIICIVSTPVDVERAASHIAFKNAELLEYLLTLVFNIFLNTDTPELRSV